jgi:glycosyltransferase involved in cell wall biosynthesis
MRVLLVHNRYGSSAPSGENVVVDAERRMLERAGHEVALFGRDSDAVRARGVRGAIEAAVLVPWNPATGRAVRDAVEAFRPDVVHVHNTFPLISPSVFHAIGTRVPRVLTLHNYRLVCAAAIPMREGRVCTECIDRRSVRPALVHGCYRESRVATAPLAAGIALHRTLGTWDRQVEAFVALTAFQRDLMVAAGLPAARVHVKPNFFEGDPVPLPWAGRDEAVVYAGRLSTEKGVDALVEAWLRWGPAAPELRIVGDGSLRASLEAAAARRPEVRIRFLGRLSPVCTAAQIARARLLVLPSVWFETFGMVLCEAFAFGTPVAVSDLGALPSVMTPGVSGVTFEPGRPDALLATVRAAWSDGRLERMSSGARAEFERRYTEQGNLEQLLAIYGRAIAERAAVRA